MTHFQRVSTVKSLAFLALLGILASTASAQLFSESFDSSAANVKINQDADTLVSYVDYGNYTRGGSTFMIPEAPRSVAGAPTRGIVLEANVTGVGAGGVNVLAGMTPTSFSGNYRVSFDSWQNLNNNPFPSGSTENLLWGVGNDDAGTLERGGTAGSGTIGVFGFLTGENGNGTEDADITENDVELLDAGDTGGPELNFPNGQNVPFDAAFPCNADGTPSTPDAAAPNGAAMLDWVQVDIDVSDNGDGTSNVGVYFNFVEFFNETVATSSVNGFAMMGYEDRFNSLNTDPENTFGLFDNLVVTADPTGVPTGTVPHPTGCVVPEPSSIAIALMGFLACLGIRRRR